MVHLESGGANVAANSSGEGGSVSRRGAGASRGGSKLKLGDGSVAGQYHFVFNVCVCPLRFTPVCYQSASSNRIATLFSTFAHFTSPQFASPCRLQRGTAAAESRASAQTLVIAYCFYEIELGSVVRSLLPQFVIIVCGVSRCFLSFSFGRNDTDFLKHHQ